MTSRSRQVRTIRDVLRHAAKGGSLDDVDTELRQAVGPLTASRVRAAAELLADRHESDSDDVTWPQLNKRADLLAERIVNALDEQAERTAGVDRGDAAAVADRTRRGDLARVVETADGYKLEVPHGEVHSHSPERVPWSQ
jgi:erythromycin esterase-like protein